MNSSVGGEIDHSQEQLKLGTMLIIALAAVVATTLVVWVGHFMRINTTVAPSAKQLPHLAMAPLRSLSSSPEDLRFDQDLTEALTARLSNASQVEALPLETDVDPIVVGRQTGAKVMIMGMVERLGRRVRVNVQMISAVDGRQLWKSGFDGDSGNLGGLSEAIDKALVVHLTPLLD